MVYLISDMAIAIAAVGYLAPLLGGFTPLANLLLALLIISLINIRGVSLVASVELALTILKYLSLLIIPLGGMLVRKGEHFYPINPHQLNISAVLSQAILLTLWSFVGLKTVITTTWIINNLRRTVPRAIMVGTSVVVLYLLNRKKNKLYSWMALLSLLLFCWLVVTGFSKDIWLGLLPILTGLPLYLWQNSKWKIWKSLRLVSIR
jgi:amino acid transporter